VARKPLSTPIHSDNWLRLYPVPDKLGIAFHPTSQELRRSFSTHGKKEAHPTEMHVQLGHSDIRSSLDIYTQIRDPEVARMMNQITNCILGLAEELEPGSVQ
jgi:integrase